MSSSSAGIVWLNTKECARRLGITLRTLYTFIDDGQLPAYKFGRVYRLKETDLEAFIESCRITPGSLSEMRNGTGEVDETDDEVVEVPQAEISLTDSSRT